MNSSKLLIVGNESEMIRDLGRMLQDLGEVRFATDDCVDLGCIAKDAPDIVLLDAEMSGVQSLEFCKMMKADPFLRDIPVIICTAQHEPDFELAGFRVGAADFVAKPVVPELVLNRVKTHLRLKAVTDELRVISKVDPLTQLATRSHLDDMLSREWSRSLRSGQPLAVVMFEVDHFDRLVERNGRRAGDECLLAVANAVCVVATRPGDVTARFDDHVFAILLAETSRTGVQSVVRRIIGEVKHLSHPNSTSPISRFVTVSAGVGYHQPTGFGQFRSPSAAVSTLAGSMLLSPYSLQESAMRAMHAARNAGCAQAWWLDVSGGETQEIAYGLQI